MANTTFSIRMNNELKKEFEKFCSNVGMNPTTAFNLFARTVVRERRIPFEISDIPDPFYSESNLKALRESIAQAKRGEFIVKTIEELDEMAK